MALVTGKNLNQSTRVSLEAQDAFFSTLGHEVRKLYMFDGADYELSKNLGMAPEYAFNNVIPVRLAELSKLRLDLIENSHQVQGEKIRRALELSDAITNSRGFASKNICKLKSLEAIIRDYLVKDIDPIEVREIQVANDVFCQKANQLYDILGVLLGIVKIRSYTRYVIKLTGDEFVHIDIYRWVSKEDVNRYDQPRWHYSFNFKNRYVYIRRPDREVVFCGRLYQFINRMLISRY